VATNIINLGPVSNTGVFLALETTNCNGIDLRVVDNGGGSTLLVETSPDNSVWTAYTGGSSVAAGALTALWVSTFSNKGVYFFPVTTKYIRFSVSVYVSGTVSTTYELSTGNNALPVQPTQIVVPWTGSAAAPSFTVSNDLTTGMFPPNGTQSWGVSIAGIVTQYWQPSQSQIGANAVLSWSNVAGAIGTGDVKLNRRSANNLQIGGFDVAVPNAQTITAQSVVAGTTNTAAPNMTLQAPAGTGIGLGGSFKVQVAPAGISGSSVNAWVDAMTIDSTKLATFAGPVKTTPTTVAALLAAATVGAGARSFVTDATASTFASTVVGGGTNKVPVYSDGTNWLIG